MGEILNKFTENKENDIRILYILFFFVLSPLYIVAQEKKGTAGIFKGQMIDSISGKTVPYATIRVGQSPNYDKIVRAEATNEDGEFKIELLPGKYKLTISSLGYKPLVVTGEIKVAGETVNLGRLRFNEDEVALKEVVIKPLVSVSSSEIVYNLDQDPDRETSTLHQMLDKVPMIGRTPDNKLYVGEPGSSFLVVRNGKKDALFDEMKSIDEILKAIPAKAFSSVTVKLIPESRYGSYKYVVSIETDKTNRLIGAINLNDDKYDATQGELQLISSLMSSYDKLRLNLGGIFTNINSPKVKTFLKQTFTSDKSLLTQENKEYKSGEGYMTGTVFSYDLGKQYFVTGRLIYNDSHQRNKKDLYTWQQKENGDTDYSNVNSVNRTNSDKFSGELNLQYDFKKPKRIINILYDFSYSPAKQETDIVGHGSDLSVPPEQEGTQRENQHTVQVHYSDPLSSKIGLEAGMNYIFRDYQTHSKYSDLSGNILPEQSHDMESSKHIIGNYINMRYRSKKLSASLKLTSEYVDDGEGTKVIYGETAPQYISESGFNLTPTASVSLMFPEKLIQSIGLSYRYNKRRPGINMMTTNTDYTNPNYILVGNPKFSSENIHIASLLFRTKFFLSFSLSGTYSNNKISQYWYKDENERIVRSYANYGSYKSVSFATNYMMLKIKNANFHISCNQVYTQNTTVDNKKTEGYNILASLFSSIRLFNFISLGVDAGYYSQRIMGMEQVKMDPFNLSLSSNFKLFKERLEVEVYVSNITRLRNKTERQVDTDLFSLYQQNKVNIIPLRLNLKWRLGSFAVNPIRNAHKRAVIDDISTE